MSDEIIVVKHNALIEAGYKLSIYETRILLICIGKLDSMGKLSTSDSFEISAKQLIDLPNKKGKGNGAYDNLRISVDRLLERIVVINLPNDEVLKTHWVSSEKNKKNEGVVSIRFAHEVIPFISQLSRDFTKYELANVMMFKSSYSIRFYELFKKSRGTSRLIEIDWIKRQFQLEDKYKQIGNLKMKVIDPALKEINLHSDLKVSYEQVKRGRSVVAFDFKYRLKRGAKPKQNKPHSYNKTSSGLSVSEIEAYANETYPMGSLKNHQEIAQEMLIKQKEERGREDSETLNGLMESVNKREAMTSIKDILKDAAPQ